MLTSMLLCSAAYSQQVRDSKASLVDVPAQQRRLSANRDAARALGDHSCVATESVPAPQGPIEIPHHYLKGSNGAVNPAEAVATRPYTALEQRVTAGANQWLATGREAEAQCALAQLDEWAKAGALLDYDPAAWSQSWYQVEWTLSSLGIADSVLVNDAKLDSVQQRRVNEWLARAANRMLSFDKPRGNNHHYWRGLAATSIGVAAGDDGLFRKGVAIYKEGISEIDSRGGLPQELARHENAIHYQGFALQPLILIAQFALRQGDDLYSYVEHGKTLRDAVIFFGDAAADPSLVKPYTDDVQRGGFGAADFAAEAFVVARFGPAGLPGDVVESLQHATWQTRIGGDTLLYVAPRP